MGLALIVVASASCSSSPATKSSLKVALFQDLAIDDHTELVSPSYFGLQIGLTQRGQGLAVTVDQFDVSADPSGGQDTAKKIVSDPSYVAVVLAPFVQETPEVAKIFADAGLAVLSLSPDSRSGGVGASWRSLVPGQAAQASALAGALAARGTNGVCFGSAPDPYSTSLAALVRANLPNAPSAAFAIAGTSADAAVKLIKTSGCSVVGWVGFPSAAAALRSALSTGGLGSVPMIGADAMKTISYIQEPGRDGTIVTCPCADVTTSPQVPAQQLVHDYQAGTGLEPGVYAAEGWDAAGILLQVLRASITRSQVNAGIGAMASYPGVARAYSFSADGSLAAGTPAGLYESMGVRWIQVGDVLVGGVSSNGA
jgi:branched-chain amino acid transport system substrate-binding protein